MGAPEFGAVLAEFRRELGWTLAEMSDALGRVPKSAGGVDKPLSETGITRIEKGERRLIPPFVKFAIGKLQPYGLNAHRAWEAAYPEVVEAIRRIEPFRDRDAVATLGHGRESAKGPVSALFDRRLRRDRRRQPRTDRRRLQPAA